MFMIILFWSFIFIIMIILWSSYSETNFDWILNFFNTRNDSFDLVLIMGLVLMVKSCKLYYKKDKIALTQTRKTEIFSFITVF